MSSSSKIEWTDATWNPLLGCTHVSSGCKECYAAALAAGRLRNRPEYEGLAVRRNGRAAFTGKIRLLPERLDQPLRWRKPRRVFVNSMSDLFHPDVPLDFIDRVFAVMALAPRHTFQVLTKRPERMAEYLTDREEAVRDAVAFDALDLLGPAAAAAAERMGGTWEPPQIDGEGRVELAGYFDGVQFDWPLPNVWLGTSIENQATADERIPHLLEVPAAVRFLSCEPLLGPIDLGLPAEIHWVIVGGESGPKARPMHPDWARSIRDQCINGGVPFHFKQWGEWISHPVAIVYDPAMLGGRAAQWSNYRWSVQALEAGQIDRTLLLGDHVAERVGKKAAGRELDGRPWNEEPAVFEVSS
jgi:protein gp37